MLVVLFLAVQPIKWPKILSAIKYLGMPNKKIVIYLSDWMEVGSITEAKSKAETRFGIPSLRVWDLNLYSVHWELSSWEIWNSLQQLAEADRNSFWRSTFSPLGVKKNHHRKCWHTHGSQIQNYKVYEVTYPKFEKQTQPATRLGTSSPWEMQVTLSLSNSKISSPKVLKIKVELKTWESNLILYYYTYI